MKLKAKIRHLLLVIYYLLGRKSSVHNTGLTRTRVLVFHHLDKPNRFNNVINKLKRNYNFISFDDYLSGEVNKNKVNLILAFDDGYKSWSVFGENIFIKHGLKPLFFVNSDYVDLSSDESFDFCRNKI